MYTKWYLRIWFVVLMLIFFPPVGLILMLISPRFHTAVKVIISIFYAIPMFLFFMLPDTDYSELNSQNQAVIVEEAQGESISETIDGTNDKKVIEVNENIKEEVEQEEKYFSQEDEEYLNAITMYLLTMADNLYTTGDLMEKFTFSDEWYIEMTANIFISQKTIDEIRQVQPPEKFKDMHNIFMKSVNEYGQAYEKLPIAIDAMDENLLYEVSDHLKKGTAFSEQSSEMLEGIFNKYERR